MKQKLTDIFNLIIVLILSPLLLFMIVYALEGWKKFEKGGEK